MSENKYGWKLRSLEIFLEMAHTVHGDKYDYSKTIFLGSTKKLTITCKEHGDFEQLARGHVQGRGCPECRYINSSKNKKAHHLNLKSENIVQPEEYKLIPLDKGAVAKVDNEDFEKVIQYGWYICRGYATNTRIGHMHRFIMQPEGDLVVDHINHDKSDNRKENLRVCSRAENSRNRKIKGGMYSQYKGVTKGAGKYHGRVTYNYKPYHLGSFDTEEEAAKAYDKKALELFGEFYKLNFPELKDEYLKQIKTSGEQK